MAEWLNLTLEVTSLQVRQNLQSSSVQWRKKSLLSQGVSYLILAYWKLHVLLAVAETSCMRNSGKNLGKRKTTAISHRKNCNAAIPLHCCNKIWSLEQKDDKAAQPILNGISFCCLTQASHAFDDKKGFWTTPLIICSNFWSPLKYSGSWIRWLF